MQLNYIVDKRGKRKSVIFGIKDFNKLKRALEDFSDLRCLFKRQKEKNISLEDFISSLKSAAQETGGVQSVAAKKLGLHRTTLHARMNALGLK